MKLMSNLAVITCSPGQEHRVSELLKQFVNDENENDSSLDLDIDMSDDWDEEDEND